MSSERHLLFIYGTLRKEGTAHHYMESAEFKANGTISGRLVHVEQSPGLIPCDDQHVIGEVYLIDDTLLQQLDRYEGCHVSPPLYLRQEIEVQIDTGEIVNAYKYVFKNLKPEHQPIPHGDWIKWIQSE